MHVSRESCCHSPRELHMPQPYTATPNGFWRRLWARLRLPVDDVTTPNAGEASAPLKEPDARDQA